MPLPKKSGTPPLNLPNEGEFSRLMHYVAAKLKKASSNNDAKGVRDCHIIYTMFFSGASAEDLEYMRVGDIDLHQGWINIGAEGSARRRKVNINVSLTTRVESLSTHLRYWLDWKRDHDESIKDGAPLFSARPGFVQSDLGDPLSAAGYYTVWKNIRNSANLRRHFSLKCARVWFVRVALKFYKNPQYISGLTAIPLKEVMELTKDMRLEQPTKEAPARKPVKKKGTALPKKAHPEKAKAPPKVNIEDTIDTAFTQSIARAFHETVSDVRAIKRQMPSQERQLVRIESHIDSIDVQQQGTNKLHVECIQPEDQTEEMRVLAAVSEACSNGMSHAVAYLVRKRLEQK